MSDRPHSQENAFDLPAEAHKRRFYFDVREGSQFTSDDVGLEFDSLDAVEREAALAAAEIGRDQLPKGRVRDVTVEVRDDHQQRVLTVVVSMWVERVVHHSASPGATGGG